MQASLDRFADDQSAASVTFSRVLTPGRTVILDASTKAEALQRMVSSLGTAPEIGDVEGLTQGIFEREKLLSTGIGLHAAVPHVRLESVSDLVMAVGLAPHGIEDYEAIDGLPVYLVFAIAANVSQHGKYIQLLAKVSRLIKDSAIRHRLLSCRTASDLYACILEQEGE